jgi:hypothetical protein
MTIFADWTDGADAAGREDCGLAAGVALCGVLACSACCRLPAARIMAATILLRVLLKAEWLSPATCILPADCTGFAAPGQPAAFVLRTDEPPRMLLYCR